MIASLEEEASDEAAEKATCNVQMAKTERKKAEREEDGAVQASRVATGPRSDPSGGNVTPCSLASSRSAGHGHSRRRSEGHVQEPAFFRAAARSHPCCFMPVAADHE